jgi:hypothetical protein
MADSEINFATALKALMQLGLVPVAQAGLYQLGLRSGYWRWRTPAPQNDDFPEQQSLILPLNLPTASQLQRVTGKNLPSLLQAADEICKGRFHPFGGEAAALDLAPGHTLTHWTAYERGRAAWGADDVKLVWEPARFGWAITLARAYLASGNDDYAQILWLFTENFIRSNPPYLGPNWTSGQEVAIRILALALAGKITAASPACTPRRMHLLAESLAAHAARIPPTQVYARSQNNNHLLVEAAGLYTAGTLLAGLAHASEWQQKGWRIFQRAIQRQIARDGTYVQHSMNYHRLMLQTALWMQALARDNGETFSRSTMERLAAATHWLLNQIDPLSGRAPNLGHNDGAIILPLATGEFGDYRPVAQAASRAFLGNPVLPAGPWDEMSLWLGLINDANVPAPMHAPELPIQPTIKAPDLPSRAIIRGQESWASLRAARYTNRPGQCDQLHVELWWRGQNLALDAGTFRYNGPPPWENGLATTVVHNTVMVDGREQMKHASRFLWLDWAQASYLPGTILAAEHTGYVRYGIRHQRSLAYSGTNHWQVIDTLLPERTQAEMHSAILHWLLPDLPWELSGTTLGIKTSSGTIRLRLALAEGTTAQTYLQLVRAGKVLAGPGTAAPVLGWYSPTYNLKIPALSFRFFIEGVLPLTFSSDWFLP